jgi:hypothetical protein
MHRRIRIRLALAALATVAALGGCSDDPTGPDLTPEGDVHFGYMGDLSGQFEAVGRLDRRNPGVGTWAVGDVQDTKDGPELIVDARQERQDGRVNGLLLGGRLPQVGTVTCEVSWECPFSVTVILGQTAAVIEEEGIYRLEKGSLTISGVTDERAAGDFSLTLVRNGNDPVRRYIQIVGAFDVPLTRRNW